MLPVEAGAQYGLLGSARNPTPTVFCRGIAVLPTVSDAYPVFAKHILLNCNGQAFVSMLRTMLGDDSVHDFNADNIARYSTRNCGLRIIEHNGAINTLRMYLARAGVFPDRGRSSGRSFWTPNVARINELLGTTVDLLESVAGLQPKHHAFLRALCTVADPGEWKNGARIREHAERLHPDVQFSRASLVNDVVKDLFDLGLVEYTTGRGQAGGKATQVRETPQFQSEILEPYLAHAARSVGRASERFLRMPGAEIKTNLESRVPAVKGAALEALAIRVMRTLNLEFDGWRKRAADTAYSEVDVSLIGVVSCLPTKWQVQCKNTPTTRISNEDVAREVGVAGLHSVTHVLFLANTRYSDPALQYADRVNKQGALTVFLLDKDDLEKVLEDFSALTTVLREKSRVITTLRA